jgi:hypothetical protein
MGWLYKLGMGPHWKVLLYVNMLYDKDYICALVLLITDVYLVTNSLKGSGFMQESIFTIPFAITDHGLDMYVYMYERMSCGITR